MVQVLALQRLPFSDSSFCEHRTAQPSRLTSSIATKEDRTMSTYTAVTVPTQFVEANGIRFAYRRWGKRSGLRVVFNQHFTGNLDDWDPAVLARIAQEREVNRFNNTRVSSSKGDG